MSRKVTPETALKQQVREYLDLHGVFSFPLTAGLGSFKGVPDRVMHWHDDYDDACPDCKTHVVFSYSTPVYLELKTPNGKLSPHQQAFKAQCEKDGIEYWEIRSLQDLIERMGLKDEVI